jgi:outer membrane protein TolC
MSKRKIYLAILIIIFLIFESSNIYCQGEKTTNDNPNDTLSLNEIINNVIQNHPSVKEIKETINEAGIKTDIARTGYYPNLDINASYTRLGPVSKISFPGFGSFELFPANNYSSSLNLRENIFDFGKTSRDIEYQNENIMLARQKLEQLKQSLALTTINCYFTIIYLQEAIKIKDEQLYDLRKHLDFVTKKKETGSAIKYEILTTQVRITNIESQKTDIESYLKIQQSVLNSLLGKPVYSLNNIKTDTNAAMIGVQNDSLISFAIENRIEMRMAIEKTTLEELNYKVVQSRNYPVINIFASGGWKNGFFPDMFTMTANYAAGIEVVLPVLDFGRNKNNLLLSQSKIIEDNYEIEIQKRKIENEVIENLENLKTSQKKLEQFKLQLSQAEEAYSLAEINFKDGAITNLDLLDASTNVSESRLLLLKVKIDYLLNTYKLKASLGIRLY